MVFESRLVLLSRDSTCIKGTSHSARPMSLFIQETLFDVSYTYNSKHKLKAIFKPVIYYSQNATIDL